MCKKQFETVQHKATKTDELKDPCVYEVDLGFSNPERFVDKAVFTYFLNIIFLA